MSKRQMNTAIQPQAENPDVAALSTIGMRIRKAVADGYNNGNTSNGLNNPYNVQRVPLPSHLSQPPSLTNHGSTIDSCSNVSEWESRYQNNKIVTIPQSNFDSTNKLKRNYDDIDDSHQAADLSDYRAKYGQLSFNEDF